MLPIRTAVRSRLYANSLVNCYPSSSTEQQQSSRQMASWRKISLTRITLQLHPHPGPMHDPLTRRMRATTKLINFPVTATPRRSLWTTAARTTADTRCSRSSSSSTTRLSAATRWPPAPVRCLSTARPMPTRRQTHHTRPLTWRRPHLCPTTRRLCRWTAALVMVMRRAG